MGRMAGVILIKEASSLEQKLVDELFNNQSNYWKEIYTQKDVSAIIHQQRRAIALRYIDGLLLQKTAHVLEIGCGAGFVTVTLAKKGFIVEATDNLVSMIKLTQQNALQNGVSDRIHATIEDVHELSFPDKSFDLVVALGVTPWLHHLKKALSEISRVLKPNGFVVLNSDNRNRLNYLLDPLLTPALDLPKKMIKRGLGKARLYNEQKVAHPHMYRIKEFNSYLSEAELISIKSTNLGFGPFTLLGHTVFSNKLGVKIHHTLQKWAWNDVPILRSTGSQYLVLAKKKNDCPLEAN
jgi:ubiquinone/menaquinone biosynthesis C-methylase UbiE